MDADVLVDDELHAREPDPVVGQHRGVKASSGLPRLSMISVRGRGTPPAGTRVTSNASWPS